MMHFRHNLAVKCLAMWSLIALLNGLALRVVMTKFYFDYPIVLMILQMGFSLLILEIGRMTKIFKLQPYTFTRGKDMFLPSLLYSLSTYISLNCLDGVTMPLFPFIQRFYPIAIIGIYHYLLRRKRPSLQSVATIVCICFGSGMATFHELNIDPWHLLYSFLALGMFALSLVSVEKLYEQYNSALELVYMNTFNCLCIYLIADLAQDEVRDALMYLFSSTTELFVITLILATIIGAVFHAALFYSVSHVSALNTALVHNCVSAVQIVLMFLFSLHLFYDLAPGAYHIGGVVLCLVATAFYYISPKDAEIKLSGEGIHRVNKFAAPLKT